MNRPVTFFLHGRTYTGTVLPKIDRRPFTARGHVPIVDRYGGQWLIPRRHVKARAAGTAKAKPGEFTADE